jgi:hypothetical protein
VGEYWIVGPLDQYATVFVLEDGRYRRVGEYAQPGPVPCATLPGLALDWSNIFTEPAK